MRVVLAPLFAGALVVAAPPSVLLTLTDVTKQAGIQFTHILDFMIMAPLGALIMPKLGITPRQFGLVVSAYAFSAGISGFVTAGFADRFDRKKILLFFYGDFLCGTLWCGLAQSGPELIAARLAQGATAALMVPQVLATLHLLFADHARSRAFGIYGIVLGLAGAAGFALGGILVTWAMTADARLLVEGALDGMTANEAGGRLWPGDDSPALPRYAATAVPDTRQTGGSI